MKNLAIIVHARNGSLRVPVTERLQSVCVRDIAIVVAALLDHDLGSGSAVTLQYKEDGRVLQAETKLTGPLSDWYGVEFEITSWGDGV